MLGNCGSGATERMLILGSRAGPESLKTFLPERKSVREMKRKEKTRMVIERIRTGEGLVYLIYLAVLVVWSR